MLLPWAIEQKIGYLDKSGSVAVMFFVVTVSVTLALIFFNNTYVLQTNSNIEKEHAMAVALIYVLRCRLQAMISFLF